MELLKKAAARKYIVNSNAFLLEDDISYYLLGAYMTDGCINDTKHHVCFSLSSKDKDWLESIRDVVCYNKPIYGKKNNAFSFEASDIKSMNWLMSKGCVPRKSITLELLTPIPTQYHCDFVRGLIDGDGSISSSPYAKTKKDKTYHYTKRSVYLCSASKIFLEQVKSMIPENIKCNIYNLGKNDSIIRGRQVKAANDIYRLTFSDSNAKKLLAWIYYPGHQLSMPRKQKLAVAIGLEPIK